MLARSLTLVVFATLSTLIPSSSAWADPICGEIRYMRDGKTLVLDQTPGVVEDADWELVGLTDEIQSRLSELIWRDVCVSGTTVSSVSGLSRVRLEGEAVVANIYLDGKVLVRGITQIGPKKR